MDEDGLREEIAELQREKEVQLSKEARNKFEDDIIDTIHGFLVSTNREYRAVVTECKRLGRVASVSKEIVQYTIALNKSLKETRGAIGTDLADFLIPGKIGTMGSSIQRGVASNARAEANSAYSNIFERKEELIAMRDRGLKDVIAGLDVMFDAIQIAMGQSGLDIGSVLSAGDHYMEAKDTKKVLKAALNVANKINALQLEKDIKKREDFIRNSIADTRRRVS